MAAKFRELLAQTIYLVSTVLNIIHNGEALNPNGANVCQTRVSSIQFYKQSYRYTRRVSYKTSCGLWGWGRCTRYRTAYGVKYRDATRQTYKMITECCKGWKQVGNQCPQAICIQGCIHGTCTQPNNCACSAGYYGNLCERECPPHKWGAHCKHDCICANNSKCSRHTGNCSCTPGWEGKYCDKPCDQGYYGDKCQSVCQCQNSTHCDVISGNCTCAPGYHGERCTMPCLPGSYGKNCASKCACPENATCDHVNGMCNCTTGWRGNQCRSQTSLCGDQNCMHGSSCNHVTGKCQCSPGWIGDICNQTCPQGTYGYLCAQKCLDCPKGATCDHVTGICVCMPGYIGERCQYSCQEGTYGVKCSKKCACQNNATCSPIDGFCNCTPGFNGVHCENQCSSSGAGGDLTQGCEEETRYDKTFQAKINHLLPVVLGTISFVIVAAIAIGCLVRYKRSKRMSEGDETAENANPQVTEYTDIPQAAPGNEERIYQTPSPVPLAALHSDYAQPRHYAEPTSSVAAPKTHVYDTPTPHPQCTAACGDVNVAKTTNKYMELHKPASMNVYEPMSPVTRNKTEFPVGEDGEVMQSNNEYENLQPRNGNDYEPLRTSSSLPPEKQQSK